MLRGYSRTSTCEQVAGLEAQVRDLEALGCERIYSEQVSSVGERPEFERALADLQPGDTLVVTKIDRFARSNVGFWQTVDAINAKKAFLRILNLGGETIDTKSATGRLILTVFAGFAQFEREIMLERQREGILKAQAEGKFKGRKPTQRAKTDQVLALRELGHSKSEIARRTGMARVTVGRLLEAHASLN